MATYPRWGDPAFPDASPRRLFWPCVGRDDLHADNPLSHPPRGPDSTEPTRRAPRTRSPRRAPNATRFPSPGRLPPTSPMKTSLRSRERRSLRAATGTPRMTRAARLPTCVHAQPLRARSTCLPRLFAGARGPHAAHRLLQLRGSTSTPTCGASPAPSLRTPKRAQGGWPCSLAGACQLDCLRPGVAAPLRMALFQPPPRRPLAPVDLPQPDRSRHPSRGQMPDALWNDESVERPCGDRPPLALRPELRRAHRGILLTRPATLARDGPFRAASHISPRKVTRSAAPEVSSSSRASDLWGRAELATRTLSRSRREPLGTFLTDRVDDLDRVATRSAQPP